MKRIWELKAVKIIPIIIGALGAILKETEVALKKINAPILSSLQKSGLLGTEVQSGREWQKYHRMV